MDESQKEHLTQMASDVMQIGATSIRVFYETLRDRGFEHDEAFELTRDLVRSGEYGRANQG